MRHLTVLLLCTGVLWASCAALCTESATVPLGVPDFTHSEAHLSVTLVSSEQTTIALESPTIVTQSEIVDYQTYQQFGIAGEQSVMQEGSPTVPQVTRFYRIPNTGGTALVITNAEYDIVDNVNPLPLQIRETGFRSLARNETVYLRGAWYPENVAMMSDPMIMRDFRVVTVTLYPVQVNPVTHQARIYRHLSADIVANGQPGSNELVNAHRISREWASIYRGMIANLDDNALDDMTTTPGSLMILTSTNAIPRPWADSLADWKTRMGYRVIVDARAAWTTTTAINAIRNNYAAAPSDQPLEFVVLMGDPGASWGIPVDNNNNSFDHSYALANTGDDLEDIGVGRLSGSSAFTLAVINAKIMGYERNPHLESSPGVADTMWFHKAFLYAGLARGSADNYLMMRWAKQQFIANTAVDSVDIATHNSDNINQNDVTTRLNAGVSFFFWQGTWIGGMPSNIADVCNGGWRLPICVTMAEDGGDYDWAGVNSPAEDFLCAGTVANPKGGVCGIGTSTSGLSYNTNVYLTSGLFYNITDLVVEHLGTAIAGAKAQLYYSYGAAWPDPEGYPGGIAAKHTRLLNLLGDPSLSIWTDVPRSLSVTHPDTLNAGASSVEITVRRAADSAAVEDAVVCLWKHGPDSTWVTGLTDTDGHITLPVSVNTSGDMFLTITKHNTKPYLYTIPCTQAAAAPMYSSVVLDDDNIGGTIGNGDHLIDPGETIDLPVYVRNFGNTTAVTGISATLASGNPLVTIVSGVSTFGNIDPGDSSLAATSFRIHVSQSLQDNVRVLLPLTITSSVGQTVGAILLDSHAGNAQYQRHQFSAAFDPGTTVNLTVIVRNMGSAPMTGVTGQLVPLSQFVQANVATASFADIAVGALDSNAAAPFSITARAITIRGLQAPMRLILTTSSGFADTTQFTVSVGTAQTTDPTGPDAYGYYAYDNTDTSYELHPTFNYVDISSTGQNLNLNDNGEKTTITPIWSTVRNLPFRFKFYGQVYDSITVCSNGWCAFGDQSWYDGFRNFPIPAMRAPDAMIAPYWDDLVTSGTGHGVWVQNDTTNHRYIIQWKASAYFGNPNLDFEVMLSDTTFEPTFTGDGKVLVQYNHLTMNIQPQYPDDSPGCTIGIQKPGNIVGLEYAYINTYAPGAATVQDGLAILFTTDARMLFGQIQGTVVDAGTSQPLAGVSVGVNGYVYSAVTDIAGHYLIPDVLVGTYGLHASLHRFNTDSVANIVVQFDSTATANFTLHHPVMTLSVDSLADSIGGVPAQSTFNIINGGNGPLDYDIRVFPSGAHSIDPWDSVGSVNASQLTGNYELWGCEFAENAWWVTGAGIGGPNKIYCFDFSGNLADSILQPSTTVMGWFDMAYDGHYLYGSDSHVIYGIDLSGQVHDTIPSPLNPTRAIAYDSLTGHFWVADYTSDIFEIDRSGNIVHLVANSTGLLITGLAWNAADSGGYKLYIFSQNGDINHARLTRMLTSAPYTMQTVVDLPTLPGDRAGGCTITPAWNSTLLVFGSILRGASGADHLEIYQMAFNTTWIIPTPAQSNVPGGNSAQITVHYDPASLRDGSYRVDLRIRSLVYDSTFVLPVHLIVNRSVAVDPGKSAVPTRYALHQNFPNPFNPTTTIRYELKSEGLTRLSVYNLLGEKVADLINARQPAGYYETQFDASPLSSGVYFYRLTSGQFTQSAKMVLMK